MAEIETRTDVLETGEYVNMDDVGSEGGPSLRVHGQSHTGNTFLARHNSARYRHDPGSQDYLTVKVTAVVCVTDPDAEIVTA
jgi:hypothetical protein